MILDEICKQREIQLEREMQNISFSEMQKKASHALIKPDLLKHCGKKVCPAFVKSRKHLPQKA